MIYPFPNHDPYNIEIGGGRLREKILFSQKQDELNQLFELWLFYRSCNFIARDAYPAAIQRITELSTSSQTPKVIAEGYCWLNELRCNYNFGYEPESTTEKHFTSARKKLEKFAKNWPDNTDNQRLIKKMEQSTAYVDNFLNMSHQEIGNMYSKLAADFAEQGFNINEEKKPTLVYTLGNNG